MKLLPFDPTFCIITPTPYLEQFASQSSMHLVLAHLVDTDERYANFYHNRDELKIMDNGAFELGQSYNPDKLLELAAKCDADVIVLPDYPGQPGSKTIEAAEKYLPIFKKAGYRVMFVPQSLKGDVDDYVKCYEWAANHPGIDVIGCSILGMPNAIPYCDVSYARVVMSQILIERGVFNFNKFHHYLGIQNISLEIPTLLRMKCLNSCDSSNPVWAGISGFKYNTTGDSYLQVSKRYLHEVNFNEKLHKLEILDIVQYNVDIALGLFESQTQL
jgi:hypothetical protein